MCFACLYTYSLCACSTHRGQKRVIEPLELDLQIPVSGVGDSGNQALILWKSSQYS